MIDLLEFRAILAESERPWVSYIGLVDLRPSTYIERGDVYALNPLFPGLGVSVIIHPDDIVTMRKFLMTSTYRTDMPSDAELAAFLYWTITRKRK